MSRCRDCYKRRREEVIINSLVEVPNAFQQKARCQLLAAICARDAVASCARITEYAPFLMQLVGDQMADSEEVASRPEPRRRREPAKAVREPSISAAPEAAEASPQVAEAGRRKIRGNIPYTFAPGVLKRVLEKIPTPRSPRSSAPTSLIGVRGSGWLCQADYSHFENYSDAQSGGIPTELYAQFQTEGGRPAAALQVCATASPRSSGETAMHTTPRKLRSRTFWLPLPASPKATASSNPCFRPFSAFKNTPRARNLRFPTSTHPPTIALPARTIHVWMVARASRYTWSTIST